jgi:hypothetical protein
MGRRGFQLTRRQPGQADENSLMIEFHKGPKKLNVTLAWIPDHARCSVFAVSNGVVAPKEN